MQKMRGSGPKVKVVNNWISPKGRREKRRKHGGDIRKERCW